MSKALWYLRLCFSLAGHPAKLEGSAGLWNAGFSRRFFAQWWWGEGHYYSSNQPEHDTLYRASQKNICVPDSTLPILVGLLLPVQMLLL